MCEISLVGGRMAVMKVYRIATGVRLILGWLKEQDSLAFRQIYKLRVRFSSKNQIKSMLSIPKRSILSDSELKAI